MPAAIRQAAPKLGVVVTGYLAGKAAADALVQEIGAFLSAAPPEMFPPEKLRKTLERVAAAGAEGIVVFSAGGLKSGHLWETLGEFFSSRSPLR